MNEQLTIILLVFIVIIISAAVYKLPMNTVNIALLIGVVYTFLVNTPYMNTEPVYGSCKHKTNEQINEETQEEITRYHSKQILENCDETKDDKADTYTNVKESENQFSEKDFDIKLNNNYEEVKNIYYDMACSGDNALTDRMIEQGKRPQQSIDARAKFDKYSMLHYLAEELDSAANSRWWDNDALEHEF
jgi:hypothetical protein